MLGLIWYIQLVHYPSFKYVDTNSFVEFHKHHTLKTGYIVMPVMFLELVSSGFLTWQDGWMSLNALGFYLVILIWLSTFLLSVPKHNTLQQEKLNSLISDLIATNWYRTILWSVKSCISFYLMIL